MRAVLAKIVAGSMIAGAALLASQCASDSDGSGEAGETGTGSTEGNSAGPQGHRQDADIITKPPAQE